MIRDNEAIYDEQIAPLMTQIIAICKLHGIPMLASFQLTGDDDPAGSPLMCTSNILPDGTDYRLEVARASLGRIQGIGFGGTPVSGGKQ